MSLGQLITNLKNYNQTQKIVKSSTNPYLSVINKIKEHNSLDRFNLSTKYQISDELLNYLNYIIEFLNRKINTITQSNYLSKKCIIYTNFSDVKQFSQIYLDQKPQTDYDLQNLSGLIYLLQTNTNDYKCYITLINSFYRILINSNFQTLQRSSSKLLKDCVDVIIFAVKYIVAWVEQDDQYNCTKLLQNILIW